MKKVLLTMVWLLSLTVAMNAAKQSPAVAVDTTAVDEVEVFSDTTSIDSADVAGQGVWDDWQDPWDDDWDDEWTSGGSVFRMSGLEMDDVAGMFFVVCICCIVFVLAPVALIGIILYFVYKNRKEKTRMMEMALKSGKRIPMDVMGTPQPQTDALWNKGIKQIFLGAGLAFLLWIPIGKLGLAIGALILLIGCGNVVIAHHEKRKQKEQELHDRIFNQPNSSDEPGQE